ncbi:MAG TPA: hypothetical protein VJS11_00505 [Acidobacteriaceae bacterium]|nr:hypothetical protein [Acidobacteriaceae bacterium]
MARGWESKSVEDQVEQQSQNRQGPRADGAGASAADAARARQRQLLELERERILDERTSNPIRRAALEAALNEIEAQLSKF